MSTPSARQSRIALARSTGLALPLISMPIPAPLTSTSSISTALSRSRMPIESGAAASARMRKPLNRAPLTPSAMTAGPLLIGVGGCVASQEGAAIVRRAPYVDFVFGPQTLHRLPAMLERRRTELRPQVDISFPEIEKFDHLPPA